MSDDIHFTIQVAGLDELRRSLRDVKRKGIPRAQQALDAALDEVAEWSYEAAHVHEGDLRTSQSHSSTYGRTSWEGEVAYTARGAAFELQRGDDHAAFIDGVEAATEAAFERAIDAAFRGL